MPATILKIADALVADIQARLADIQVLADVSREYEITFELGSFNGKKILVFPSQYLNAEDETRPESLYDFNLSVVVLERYRLKEDIPKSWIDDLVTFVQDNIFTPYDDRDVSQRSRFMFTVDSVDYWFTKTETATVYDYDILRQNRVFWSEVELTLRTVASGL